MWSVSTTFWQIKTDHSPAVWERFISYKKNPYISYSHFVSAFFSPQFTLCLSTSHLSPITGQDTWSQPLFSCYFIRQFNMCYLPSLSHISSQIPTTGQRKCTTKQNLFCCATWESFGCALIKTYGTGMLMTKSLSSRPSSWSSYSMLTSQLLPLSEGQQFTTEKQFNSINRQIVNIRFGTRL